MKVYKRTEDNKTTIVSVREAVAEVNHAMMDGKRDVETMSSGYGRHDITYKDGRHVVMVLVDQPEPVEEDKPEAHCMSVRGGAVHTNRPFDVHGDTVSWPECRTGGQDSRGTFYVPTGADLTCKTCIRYETYRAARG